MDVFAAIRGKRAIRHFQDKPLPEDVTRQILNAGRLSQSSKNSQPWQFVAVQKHETLQAMAKCGTWAGHLAGAALGVAIVTADPTEKFQTMFDAGQAAAYMQLAGWELGVGSCLASIYEPEQMRSILGLPLDWYVRICLSFGYPTAEAIQPRPARPDGRKAFDAVVHWDKW